MPSFASTKLLRRNELVIQRNNEAYLDGLLVDVYFGGGLLLPHMSAVTGLASFDQTNAIVNATLGEDFVHNDEPLWQLPSDSREWQRLRSAVLWASIGHLTGVQIASRMKHDADRLEQQIDAWLKAEE